MTDRNSLRNPLQGNLKHAKRRSTTRQLTVFTVIVKVAMTWNGRVSKKWWRESSSYLEGNYQIRRKMLKTTIRLLCWTAMDSNIIRGRKASLRPVIIQLQSSTSGTWWQVTIAEPILSSNTTLLKKRKVCRENWNRSSNRCKKVSTNSGRIKVCPRKLSTNLSKVI